jgi:hypothetical protein
MIIAVQMSSMGIDCLVGVCGCVCGSGSGFGRPRIVRVAANGVVHVVVAVSLQARS